MENTPQTTVGEGTQDTHSSLGGKVAIVIILLILLVGAYFYFFLMKKPANETMTPKQETTESLSTELDSTTNVDLDADLKAIEESFN